ncbi:hypothetical protein BpHYR1_030819 [Brachionus plicatilis]|uniref:Uncharacterized protein n=1 Tax=Brachionus plicatilis TaxID=10195 RepID=A0A3M7PAH1_BRAPC|nr:hypothetical protein BpHYR1_030819 [Brachionus plicatilis]
MIFLYYLKEFETSEEHLLTQFRKFAQYTKISLQKTLQVSLFNDEEDEEESEIEKFPLNEK